MKNKTIILTPELITAALFAFTSCWSVEEAILDPSGSTLSTASSGNEPAFDQVRAPDHVSQQYDPESDFIGTEQRN
jgi:hypothetical protein